MIGSYDFSLTQASRVFNLPLTTCALLGHIKAETIMMNQLSISALIKHQNLMLQLLSFDFDLIYHKQRGPT